MTHEDRLIRYADLVVRVGVNVQPGQTLVLDTDIAHAEIARAVVERAYAAGAGFVDVRWSDGRTRLSAVTHASLDALTSARPWAIERYRSWVAEGVCTIVLAGDPAPRLFEGADPVRAAAFPVAEAAARSEAVFGAQLRWSIVAAPNPGWAEQVYGTPDVERLWSDVSVAMRLDEPDPVAQWRDRAATLAARAKALDALALTEVHYVAEGTDLTVGLVPDCRWTGGGLDDPQGVAYMPNIPTEEVFTSPDRRRADGRIRLTKPVVINGQMVEGLVVTFANGRITDISATAGEAAVRAQLETDEGARSLGEVSLVDRDSRIARTGVVFHNTLFDENAGCHVAWGRSFPFSVAGGLGMNDAERFELGLNTSAVHTDVVIGGEGMTVSATGPGGRVDIIRDDEWVLAV
jgi:aminopeptidase